MATGELKCFGTYTEGQFAPLGGDECTNACVYRNSCRDVWERWTKDTQRTRPFKEDRPARGRHAIGRLLITVTNICTLNDNGCPPEKIAELLKVTAPYVRTVLRVNGRKDKTEAWKERKAEVKRKARWGSGG